MAAKKKTGTRTVKKKATKKKVARKTSTKKATKKAGGKRAAAKRATGKRSSSKKKATKRAPRKRGERLILLAARGSLLFPRVVLPIVASRPQSIASIQAATAADQEIGILLQRDKSVENPSPDELFTIGTVATIVRQLTAPDGSIHVIAHGLKRFRVLEFEQTEPYLIARIKRLEDTPTSSKEDADLEARTRVLKTEAKSALALIPQKPDELEQAIDTAENATTLTDLVATFLDIPVEERQEILEILDLRTRMEVVLEKLGKLIDVLQLGHKIRERTQGVLEKTQREHYLREQMRQIEEELGEGSTSELSELEQQIGRSRMPASVKSEVRRDLSRLQRMPEGAGEYGMLRAYLETVVELPWRKLSKDNLAIDNARAILDEDHFGLEKVKRRIIEFLAVRKLAPNGKSPILCFVGPPGVGKTSLGRSIARAMNRKFARVSLGGVHDEAEIRGHRRTYVGAMPGTIINHLRKAGTMNPVFLLDEMDKLTKSMHGDPSAALLEVLDPEQNDTFTDHYLNVPVDLSRVLFLATANVLSQIPSALRDRCEVIDLPGYTQAEKLQIARRFLLARKLADNGVTPEQFTLSDETLLALIQGYTREAGVRSLERELGAVIRHSAVAIAAGSKDPILVKPEDLATILGPVRFEDEVRLRTSLSGVATGLAWTPTGGDVLFVEATSMPGKGELLLTGQLGDVMKESAQAAMSLVKSNAQALGIDSKTFKNTDVHIHVPAGAIPKDGPSAGVTLYTALVSLYTGRRVPADLAMTGEISLRGLVLPVGGIKEKVLAALRLGITRIVLPARNAKDEVDIPQEARAALTLHWVENTEQLLELTLES